MRKFLLIGGFAALLFTGVVMTQESETRSPDQTETNPKSESPKVSPNTQSQPADAPQQNINPTGGQELAPLNVQSSVRAHGNILLPQDI